MYLLASLSGVALLSVLIWLSLRSSRSTARDAEELRHHLSFAARSLDNRGGAEIRFPGLDGAFLLETRTYSKRPKSFALRASSGYLGREAVETIARHLEENDLQHSRRRTRKRSLVRDVRMLWDVKDEDAPVAAVNSLEVFCDALGLRCKGPFTLTYRGRRDPKYIARDSDPGSYSGGLLRRLSAEIVRMCLVLVRPASRA